MRFAVATRAGVLDVDDSPRPASRHGAVEDAMAVAAATWRREADVLARLRSLAPDDLAALRARLNDSAFALSSGPADDDALVRRAAALVARGWLRLDGGAPFEIGELGGAEARGARSEPPARPAGAERHRERVDSSLTWISIELVGEDDLPIPGERYRITLDDGSIHEGRLDSLGRARVDGIDPGAAKVTFPALDADAWTPLRSTSSPGERS